MSWRTFFSTTPNRVAASGTVIRSSTTVPRVHHTFVVEATKVGETYPTTSSTAMTVSYRP